MPKQRSTMTMADVKEMLRSTSMSRSRRPQTRTAARVEDDLGPDAGVGLGEQPGTPGPAGEQPTPTAALKEAKREADSPITVEQGGKTTTVQPSGTSQKQTERKG